MENIPELLPYLNLREGEEILLINRYKNALHLPINQLYKYHEPEKFPEKLIIIRKEEYVYYPIDIITNFRIIQLGLNFRYLKNDGLTPISEAIHIENLILWINNEDILDFEINFGGYSINTIQINFFYQVGIRSQKNPLYIKFYNYKNYLRAKELSKDLFKFGKEEVDQEEQQKINEIISLNKNIFIWGLVGLLLLGLALLAIVNLDSSLEFEMVMLNYSTVIIYTLYFIFYLLFYIINLKKLQKIRKSEDFFKLIEKAYAWYHVPWKSFIFFVIGVIIVSFELIFSYFTENIFFIQLMMIGMFSSLALLVFMTDYRDKKRKKKLLQAFR